MSLRTQPEGLQASYLDAMREGPCTTSCLSLCLQAVHQRYYRYLSRLAHMKGKHNVMADDCSRFWHLSDQQLLTHFEFHYPQSKPWQLCQLRPNMRSLLISALHKQRPTPESLLTTAIGASEPSAGHSHPGTQAP